MLKISVCVVCVVMHVENYIEIPRCVENFYVRHVENRVENCLEIRKNHRHSSRCMLKLSGRGPKFRRQTTRLESEFAHVTEVRHIYIYVKLRILIKVLGILHLLYGGHFALVLFILCNHIVSGGKRELMTFVWNNLIFVQAQNVNGIIFVKNPNAFICCIQILFSKVR